MQFSTQQELAEMNLDGTVMEGLDPFDLKEAVLLMAPGEKRWFTRAQWRIICRELLNPMPDSHARYSCKVMTTAVKGHCAHVRCLK